MSKIPPSPSPERKVSSRQTFHLFPNFPPEIRELIWRLALPPPRIIKLMRKDSYDNNLEVCRFCKSDCDFAAGGWFVDSDLPRAGLLEVCHESRLIALKTHDFCFNTMCEEPASSSAGSAQAASAIHTSRDDQSPICKASTFGIRFQPDRDTLYFKDTWDRLVGYLFRFRDLSSIRTGNIKYVAIEAALYNDGLRKYFFQCNQDIPPMFSGVEELTIVYEGIVDEADKLEVEKYFREVSTITPSPRVVQVSQEKFLDLYTSRMSWNTFADETIS
jgi:2EXR family